MNEKVTVDPYDREGVFVTVVETANQSPIVLEAEGPQTSFYAARDRAEVIFGSKAVRWCVCRLVPVAGNELLAHDIQRMQK